MKQQEIIKRLESRIEKQNRTIANYRWAMEYMTQPPKRFYRRRAARLDPFDMLAWLIKQGLNLLEWVISKGIRVVIALVEWLIVKILDLLEAGVRRCWVAVRGPRKRKLFEAASGFYTSDQGRYQVWLNSGLRPRHSA